MLYIKFNVRNHSKFSDFRTLYNHLVNIRQPNFEEDEGPVIDWDNILDDDIPEALQKLSDFNPELERYKMFIPHYAHLFFQKHLDLELNNIEENNFDYGLTILSYLEYGFEVNMDNLESKAKSSGIINFSTNNFPFGGMDRFLLTLKAFDLVPTEYYNGFYVNQLIWTTEFEYDSIESPDKTAQYLTQYQSLK